MSRRGDEDGIHPKGRQVKLRAVPAPANHGPGFLERRGQVRVAGVAPRGDVAVHLHAAAGLAGDDKAAADDGPEVPNGFDEVLRLFRETLGDRIEDVRRSERLTESACCLVNSKGAQSTAMQKVLQLNMPDFEMSRMIAF